ncbi:MAG TPA: phosphatase PAP2 family protein [Daejeonella sp.]|nr:phosphatase PAP2 family protein [Daejeonella sp.]
MPKTFLGLLKQHRPFVISYLVFILIGLLLKLFFSKASIFLFINGFHSDFFDGFFKAITYLGDGCTVVIVGIALLFVKYRYSVLTFMVCIYTSAVAQILKHIFNAPRPIKYFEGISPIRTIEGYPVHGSYSFPSGHTMSAFSLAVLFIYILPGKSKYWFIFPIAALTAFSRIYLAQHFLEDIMAGSVLAVVLTFQLIWWLENKKWYHSDQLDGKLFGKKQSPH